MRRDTIGLLALLLFTSVEYSVAGSPQSPREGVAELGNVIAPPIPPALILENELAGLSSDSRPELLNWERIYALALVRARTHRESFSQLLDPAALAEEAVRQGVADFARFRTDFRINPMFRDPGPAVLELQRRLLAIDNARRTVAALESLGRMFVNRSQGASSDLNRIDIDMVFASSARARQKVTDATKQFRDGLDALKILLGLSPRAAVVVDRQSLRAFPAAFEAVENWARQPTRRAEDLYRLIDGLPAFGEVVINGELVFDKIADEWDEVVARAAKLAEKGRGEQNIGPAHADLGVQLELRARRRIRNLDEKRHAYQEEKKCYELAIRLRDQTFERLLAPPSAIASSRSGLVVALLEQLMQVRETQDRLVELWTSFRAERLVLYHDLGVLPYENWKAFHNDLSTSPFPGALAPAMPPQPPAAR